MTTTLINMARRQWSPLRQLEEAVEAGTVEEEGRLVGDGGVDGRQ